MLDRNVLYRGYMTAGSEFVAQELVPLFARIEDEGDKVIHNMVSNRIALLIEPYEADFREEVAQLVIKYMQQADVALQNLKEQ